CSGSSPELIPSRLSSLLGLAAWRCSSGSAWARLTVSSVLVPVRVSGGIMAALGLLVLRLVVGLTLAGHGAQKLFGWWGGPGMNGWTQMVQKLRIRPAQPWAWVAALAEFGGGILLALGFLSPLG